jgi:hypothetical protein
MTIEEIQQVLRTICLERSAALRERGIQPDAEAVFTTLESLGLKQVKPSPGRAALTFAGLSFEEQELIEDYAENLINQAHALCMRLQVRCPPLREGDNGEPWDLERVYKAQYHAMVRLRRRCDEGLWIRAHIRKA